MSCPCFTGTAIRSHGNGGRDCTFEKLCYKSKFDDPNLPGVMKATVTLKPVLCGTEISVVQEAIPEMIPTEMCYLGWQESLSQ